ncbi:MAG: hypothetical protein L0Y73_09435, partial [Candidatus Aminicenantes bacterium]|nr:hypothetical protein [Candidatus Aminicenantes bacterium]
THGLPTLFVPLISSYIFTGSKKPQHAALRKILEIIFSDKDWLDFYRKNDIRVRAYGNLKYLETNEYAGVLDLLEKIKQITSGNRSRTLCYGFASATEDCGDIIASAIEFYKTYGRQPTHEEQMDYYYGRNVSPADFFIMSAKFAGLGALPPLIVNRHTQLYFLAAPGVMALTEETYRKILYDLLYCRPAESRRDYTKNDLKHAEALKDYFLANRSTVFGLGKRIGNSWTPLIEPFESLKKEEE